MLVHHNPFKGCKDPQKLLKEGCPAIFNVNSLRCWVRVLQPYRAVYFPNSLVLPSVKEREEVSDAPKKAAGLGGWLGGRIESGSRMYSGTCLERSIPGMGYQNASMTEINCQVHAGAHDKRRRQLGWPPLGYHKMDHHLFKMHLWAGLGLPKPRGGDCNQNLTGQHAHDVETSALNPKP